MRACGCEGVAASVAGIGAVAEAVARLVAGDLWLGR